MSKCVLWTDGIVISSKTFHHLQNSNVKQSSIKCVLHLVLYGFIGTLCVLFDVFCGDQCHVCYVICVLWGPVSCVLCDVFCDDLCVCVCYLICVLWGPVYVRYVMCVYGELCVCVCVCVMCVLGKCVCVPLNLGETSAFVISPLPGGGNEEALPALFSLDSGGLLKTCLREEH